MAANDPVVLPSDVERFQRLQDVESLKPTTASTASGLASLVKTVAALPTGQTVNNAAAAAQQGAVDQLMPQIMSSKNIRSGVCAAKATDTSGTIVTVTNADGSAVFPDGFTVHLTPRWDGGTAPGFWSTYQPIDNKSFRIQAWKAGTVANIIPVRTDGTVDWLVRSKT